MSSNPIIGKYMIIMKTTQLVVMLNIIELVGPTIINMNMWLCLM